MIGEANARQNTIIRKLWLNRWETMEIMKTVRFQSSNFNSAGSVSKNKTVGRSGRANREMKKKKKKKEKTTRPIDNRRSKLMNFVKISIFDSF